MNLALVAVLAVLAGPTRPSPASSRPRPVAAELAGPVGAPAGAARVAATNVGAPPVRVDAAKVHYAPRRREVTFTGTPVTMTREDAKLTCARLVAKNDDKGDIVSAVCTGDVRFVRGERAVTCDTATYDNALARLTCVGHAMLRDGRTEAFGDRLTYDLRSDETNLEGESGKTVKVTVPGEQVEQRRREYEERRKARAQKEAKP
ncbi:LptA/OstA family protein [Anaeromyxobacter oryzisoli]|uniref:LptA/OstA family protein n=1 Tax=Anaeromyxobacter oryzisoli TaxID=2925408 RepID=UPI001F5823D9|nr:LptA/OstA family protein [Anaeromyxobacter sp. SG63]